jgi:hypothetical protein
MISRILTIAVYIVIGLGLAGLEWRARTHPESRVPTLAATFRWALRRRSTQLGLLLAWWWLGWHFITAS